MNLTEYLAERQTKLEAQIALIPPNTDDDEMFLERINLCGRLQEIKELKKHLEEE